MRFFTYPFWPLMVLLWGDATLAPLQELTLQTSRLFNVMVPSPQSSVGILTLFNVDGLSSVISRISPKAAIDHQKIISRTSLSSGNLVLARALLLQIWSSALVDWEHQSRTHGPLHERKIRQQCNGSMLGFHAPQLISSTTFQNSKCAGNAWTFLSGLASL